jgi:predicted AAA+ superfamily ATPase
MIKRTKLLDAIRASFRVHPVVSLLGPRQVGKTTLAAQFAAGRKGKVTVYDLESAADRRRLTMPELALSEPADLIVIDEIQRQPELFETLRVLADRRDAKTRFLVLGSAAPGLVKGVTESLAGRVGFVDVPGLSLGEVGADRLRRLWERGGFPRSFLAADAAAGRLWREDFIRTFLERDIPGLGIHIPAETLRRFWTMIAHYHGQVWNGSEFARALGTSEPTARRYLDILAGAYMVRILPPWFENIGKRQVKSPKIYVRDSGLVHALLGIDGWQELTGHPKAGASWEGFALEQMLTLLRVRDAYFWGTHSGAELDLLVTRNGKRYGFEFKLADAPGPSRSMHAAVETLGLERLFVLYPGRDTYPLAPTIEATPLAAFGDTHPELVGREATA